MSGARARHPPRRSLSYLGVGLVALAAVGLVLARGAVPVLTALAVLFVGGGLVRAGASATARAPVTGEGGSPRSSLAGVGRARRSGLPAAHWLRVCWSHIGSCARTQLTGGTKLGQSTHSRDLH